MKTAILWSIGLAISLATIDTGADPVGDPSTIDQRTPGAPPTRRDYAYLRALSIDFLGRPPLRSELADLERPDFDFDRWLDSHLAGPEYAARIRRIYSDLLRLQLPLTFKYEPPAISLHHVAVAGPQGTEEIYFRAGQRRSDPTRDGAFCFTEAESGIRVLGEGSTTGTPKPMAQALLDQRTVVVKPWWLYADYRARDPHDRLADDWAQRFPGYDLVTRLFADKAGAPTISVRVCREEAQTATDGHVLMTGRIARKGAPIPPGRTTPPPFDSDYARGHAGGAVSCTAAAGFQSAPDCGCGVGLERCVPIGPNGFVLPEQAPLGRADAFVAIPRPASMWIEQWWSDEVDHFIDKIVGDDRDMRELLTSRGTQINGPLAQFYRFLAGSSCCGSAGDLGYVNPESLFDPARVPPALVPEDTATWVEVADRGPHAAGISTMPVFLIKYGTRRARAHVLYQTFACKDFTAETAALTPSTDPDLTKRAGCASCHATLEPMAAYFARVQESDWTYLPASVLPPSLAQCNAPAGTKLPFYCKSYYDPAFVGSGLPTLRGAYAAPGHVDAGPAGLAAALASAPEFAPCVVRNVAQSLLGRPLTTDDEGWKLQLAKSFAADGYKVKSLVRAIVTSPGYRAVNDHLPGAP